jgi:O-antigen ligase
MTIRYVESRAGKSRFNAGHLAWAAMFCSILIWGFGEVQAGTIGNAGNWYRIVLVFLAGIAGGFALLTNTKGLSRAFSGPLFLLLFYGVVAMISSLYVPAYSFYSMWKGFEVVVDVIVIAGVLSYPQAQDSTERAYRIIIFLFGILMVVYLAEALLMPSSAFLPSRGLLPFMLHGVLPVMAENTVAFLAAVVTFAAWCGLFKPSSTIRRRLISVLVLALAMVTLILTQTRTSLIGLLVAVCVYLFFDRRFGWLSLIVAGAAIAASLTTFSDVAEQYLARGQSTQLFTSLSGRIPGWEAAWTLFQQSPMIGHGFAAAARIEILGAAGASTLHGSIFDVMVGVGLLGLIPWVLAVLWTSLRMFRLTFRHELWGHSGPARSKHAEMLGLLALILLRSSTSSGLAMHDHTFMFFLVVLAYASTALYSPHQPVAGTSKVSQPQTKPTFRHAAVSRRAV